MTAKEFLRSLRKMALEIDALQAEIVLMRQEAEGIKAMTLSDMPKGGQMKDAADIIAEVADLQRSRYALTLERMEKREQAMLAITKMEDGEQRAVLIMRYILGKSWDDIAEEMHYSMRGIFKLHGQALQEFEQVCSKVQLDL